MAAVTWKALRAAVRRCCRRVRRSGGRAAGLPVLRYGRLRRWGRARERVIRLLGGASARLCPQRARCRSCGRTHILLPSWCAPRRADGIVVIGTAAAAALAGAGCGRIGKELGVPASTVRGWLRRLRSRAEEMRQDAMFQLGFIGGADPVLPEPSGSPLGDALSAVAAAAHAAITGHGFTRADLWPLLGRYGLARHLAPARAG